MCTSGFVFSVDSRVRCSSGRQRVYVGGLKEKNKCFVFMILYNLLLFSNVFTYLENVLDLVLALTCHL